MTLRRTSLYWRDALYRAVSLAPGNVQAAAVWLSERRGKGITGESLRKKLRGLEGESLSMEMAELLTDYLQQFVDTNPVATDWIASLGAQYGLMVDYVPAPAGESAAGELQAIQRRLLELHELTGRLAGAGREAIADSTVSVAEADVMQGLCREVRSLCFSLERHAARAAAGTVERD